MMVYSWDNDKENPMSINIMHNGVIVMHFFLGEAMEGAGRKNILDHVKECDNTPWLKEWQEERGDAVIKKLKG